MRWSIESRVPFLTTEIAEFCLSLPEEYLLARNGETKCIFRAAMRGIVPDAVLDRRDKIGFRTPEDAWLRAQGPPLMDWITAADHSPILDPEACRNALSSAIAGNTQFSPELWRLINYCRWVQMYS
jgi:asparagine synthase (glutamine-hydrolysing)